MKQLLHIGLLIGWLTGIAPLRAQVAPRDGDARRSGSRLELGRTASTRKAPPVAIGARPFRYGTGAAAQDRHQSITFHKNTPINEYYRSLLVARSSSKTPAGAGATPAAEVASIAGDARAGADGEGHSDDRMYTSDRIWVSNIYPNPASEFAEVDYGITGPVGEAKLTLLNVLGAPVAEYELDRGNNKVRLITRDMATGHYFYQLSLDGKKVATKKLLVRHQ